DRQRRDPRRFRPWCREPDRRRLRRQVHRHEPVAGDVGRSRRHLARRRLPGLG
ncbi:MAG: hypothetical protein AVDCRST_MAG07-2661, partial [uncultured Frankineae bacterium]